MPASLMTTRRVAKPWGRHQLWPGFADPAPTDQPIGEIWFEAEAGDPDLLVKYLFTSEKLSIQVHPDDAGALARGYPRGKDEAWLVLAAEPGSTIALGPKAPISRDELRLAALDGSIEAMLDWRPVRAGDVIYSPAGTVHAIGAGLTLIEVQQNLDLTYRLYDYGRPRELHLEDGIAVSDLLPFVDTSPPEPVAASRSILAAGPAFVLERRTGGDHRLTLDDAEAWLVVVEGGGTLDGSAIKAGQAWMVADAVDLALEADAIALLAYAGNQIIPQI